MNRTLDLMQTVRAFAGLAGTRSRVHDLAAATQKYLSAKGHFPPGALRRAANPERGIDWRPDQRLAWTAELLPFLDDEYKEWTLRPELSWNEGKNLSVARRLIPQLVITQKGTAAHLIRYPGVPVPLTPTRWVGVAGIGYDAAEYKANDPAVAKKLGVFGYNRTTSEKDISDGKANTILLLMVPNEPQAPWLAGGGSTVRGVSEESDAVQPFVCTTYVGKPDRKTKFDGKAGTLAIMCDGKVRFIPADIDPNVFRALCTIAGGETISKLDDIAPVIAPDDEPELRTTGSASPDIPVGAASGASIGTSSDDKDLDPLQGVWVAERAESNGRMLDPALTAKIRWTVTEDEAQLQTGEATEKQTLALNSRTSPKQMDLTIEDGENKDKVIKAIYKLEGGKLTVAFSKPDDPNRPTTLATSAGGNMLVVFKRPTPDYKAPPRRPAARRPGRRPPRTPRVTPPRGTSRPATPRSPRRPR
jgi:uncharacterized protein (TIGR03067 family)